MLGSVSTGLGSIKTAGDAGSGGGGGVADGVTIDGTGTAGDPFSGIPSSTGNAGTMSAANFARSAGLGLFADWFANMANFMKSKYPDITETAPLWPGQQPTGTTAAPGPTPDPGVEGGGLSVGAAATRVLGSSIWQDLVGKMWAIGWRGKYATPVAGHTSYAGIQSLAGPGNHAIVGGTIFSGDATHYVLKLFGTSTIPKASTLVADALEHDFVIGSDKTTVTLWVDGVARATATGADFTNGVVGSEANQAMLFNSNAGETVETKVMVGYVAP